VCVQAAAHTTEGEKNCLDRFVRVPEEEEEEEEDININK
jgi:hypothetical protein